MKFKHILLTFFISVFFSLTIFGQVQPINREVYWSVSRTADKKTETFSRREKMRSNSYSEGKVTRSEEKLTEFLLPDKKRLVKTTVEDGKTERFERIVIGNRIYERTGKGKWKKIQKLNEGMSLRAIPADNVSFYSVEKTTLNNQPVQLYRSYSVYDAYSPKEGEEKKVFYEAKIWLNEQGLKVKSETNVGKPISKEITFSETYEYEYNPKDLKIEAPIK